jgi:threonine synthase
MRVVCSECAGEVPFGTMGRCPVCGDILRVIYPDDVIQQLKTIQPGRGIDRYRALLPVRSPLPYLGEGDTPLITSWRIGESLGLKHLYFKHEGMNPTGAFKDRAGTMAVALALDAGAEGVLCASSGNASASIAAYCAAAGLKCVILMEPGNPSVKLRQTLVTGAQVVLVEGVFAHGPDALADFVLTVAAKVGYYPGFVWSPVNPYILEGIKTTSYEIVAQLNGVPDVMIVPAGGGDMFAAQWYGYQELHRAGMIEKLPRMIAVQSLSAPPLLQAVKTGAKKVPTLPYARSKISGINVPFTGDHALKAIYESGGTAAGVTDGSVWVMQRRLALEEGIWVEPAGAAPTAALAELLRQGLIHAEERIVCFISGAGFKDATLAAQEADLIGQQPAAPFDADAVVAQIQ